MNRRNLIRLGGGLAASSLIPALPSAAGAPPVPTGNRGKKRVIVIGAGISGLAAAEQLVGEFGLHEVTVLESRDRVGGRIQTSRALGSPVDLGASWIHGITGNPITALAAKYGATTAPTDYDSADLFDTNGSPVSFGELFQAYRQFTRGYNKVSTYIQGLSKDQSLAQSLIDTDYGAGVSPKSARIQSNLLASSIELPSSANASDVSSFHFEFGEVFEGNDHVFPQGYSQIPMGLARGLDIRLGHMVEEIEYRGTVVKVHTNRGTFHCDACVVTLPLGVLKADAVAFHPALPQTLTDAIDRMGFGALYKLNLEFPNVFWPRNRELFGYISPEPGAHATFVNIHYYSGVPILTAFANQSYARSLESMGIKNATERVMRDLRAMFGPSIPDPIKVSSSDWNSNPFTRGSYAFAAVGSSPVDWDEFRKPVKNRLFFAGEHTIARYAATVHGAYLSGIDAAQRVAKFSTPRMQGR